MTLSGQDAFTVGERSERLRDEDGNHWLSGRGCHLSLRQLLQRGSYQKGQVSFPSGEALRRAV